MRHIEIEPLRIKFSTFIGPSSNSDSPGYVHSNCPLPGMPSCPAYHHLVDAKPDPRRVYLASLQAATACVPVTHPAMPASRPCSHSATPSPLTPQSLSFTSTTGSAKSAPPQFLSSLSNPFPSNSPAVFNMAATRELFVRMAILYPQLTSQQIGEVLSSLKAVRNIKYCIINVYIEI